MSDFLEIIPNRDGNTVWIHNNGKVDSEMIKVQPVGNTEFILNTLRNLHKSCQVSSLCPEPFIFGGFVRDQLLGENPSDIDICGTKQLLLKFVKWMEQAGRLLKLQRNVGPKDLKRMRTYSGYKCEIELPSGKAMLVDLVCESNEFMEKCDFTCNNLIVSLDGTISARVNKTSSKVDLTISCIRDVMTKTLRPMFDDLSKRKEENEEVKFDFIRKMQQIQSRVEKMKKKGFSIADSSSLTLFTYKRPLFQEEDVVSCSICLKDKESLDKDNLVQLCCSHVFCFDCVDTHQRFSEGTGCPLCRDSLDFELEQINAFV